MYSTPTLADLPVHRPVATRWKDNDHYGHVNNVEFYSYFDTAVNGWLIEASGVDIRELPQVGLVVETSCRYLRPVSFPDVLTVALGIEHVGTSSVRYALAMFRDDEGRDAAPVATGRFVHVYVDRETRRSAGVPAVLRAVMETALISTENRGGG